MMLWARKSATPVASLDNDEKISDWTLQYQRLIAQLKELEAEALKRSPDDYQREKAALERAAADVLRKQDELRRGLRHEEEKLRARAEKQAQASNGFWAKNPALKGALWGGGTVVFFGLLFLTLGGESKPRAEGEGITGGVGRETDASGPTPDEAFMEKLHDKLKQEPENLELLAELSDEYIRRSEFEKAQDWVKTATAIDPFHVGNRIHRALLLAASGKGGQSLQQLEHLADRYPEAQKALLYAGALAIQMGNRDRALRHFDRYLAEAPPDEIPAGLRQAISQMRQPVGDSPP
jgi:tetratricopeptide (TPR) repeat protein